MFATMSYLNITTSFLPGLILAPHLSHLPRGPQEPPDPSRNNSILTCLTDDDIIEQCCNILITTRVTLSKKTILMATLVSAVLYS